MAHIFGIPHSLSGIVGGVLEGIGAAFPTAPVTGMASPTVATGFDPFGSSFEMFEDAWEGAKALNAPGSTTTSEVVIDNATGKCIAIKKKKTRKRRRRLATASDISDLASLISVLGKGKNLDMWIATRGRR